MCDPLQLEVVGVLCRELVADPQLATAAAAAPHAVHPLLLARHVRALLGAQDRVLLRRGVGLQ